MPGREIRVDPLMPENAKILRAGGDAAWLWTCAIAYSFRQHLDGLLPMAAVTTLSDRKQPRRLAQVLVRERLWHEPGHDCPRCPQPLPGNYVIHDYLHHQGSTNGAKAVSDAKGRGGAFGNHQRWHASRGVSDPGCQFCIASSIAGGSHMRSDERSVSDGICDPPSDADANRTTDRISDGSDAPQNPAGSPFLLGGDPPPISPPTAEASRISDRPSGHVRTRRQAYDYGDDQDFHRFWATFPAKSGKPAAYKAWLAALARGAKAEDIIAAAGRYAGDPARDPSHTKYPQGWLNDERYNDAPVADGNRSAGRDDDDFWRS